ncbi:Zinc finger protein zfs1 [Diplonema papillatum]|nr:Zinc finger protein zfs1 [Diplonema papillatum]
MDMNRRSRPPTVYAEYRGGGGRQPPPTTVPRMPGPGPYAAAAAHGTPVYGPPPAPFAPPPPAEMVVVDDAAPPPEPLTAGANASKRPAHAKDTILRLYKTKICKNWQSSGACPYHAKCMFAHGYPELREQTQRSAEALRSFNAAGVRIYVRSGMPLTLNQPVHPHMQ